MKNRNIVFAITLIILGILFRTVWHPGPNVEFVTAATLLAVSYLGGWWVLAVPLLIMSISDLFIGNSNIFIFTWSGFLFISYLSKLGNLRNLRSGSKIFRATCMGVIASFWFYVWTNFGVWLLDSWGMYPKTLTGLIDCYILAIPFFKYNLIGNLLIVPVSFTVVELILIGVAQLSVIAIRQPAEKQSHPRLPRPA